MATRARTAAARDERQPLRAVRAPLPRRRRAAVPASSRTGRSSTTTSSPRCRRGSRTRSSRAGCRPGDRVAVQVDKHWQVARALPRVPARRARLPAAQHRLPAGGARVFLRRRRAARHRLPTASDLGVVAALRARGATVLTLDATAATLRDRARDAAGDVRDGRVARPTTSRRSSTRRARPAARRARCSPTATSRRTRWRWSSAWGFTRGDVLLHALPDLPRPRPVRRASHCALLAGARMLWLPKFDAREVMRAAAARDGDDGRADVLHAPARRAGVHARRAAARCGCSSRARRRCCAETFDAFAQRTGPRASSSATA